MMAGCLLMQGDCPSTFANSSTLVVRRSDDAVASWFTDAVVRAGFIWLFACIPLTYFEILSVANLAHFSGFGYGWLAGVVFYGIGAGRPSFRYAFLAGHLLLLPAAYFVMHPLWIGRYHWYAARLESLPENRVQRWEKAVALDHSLGPVWQRLAAYHVNNANLHVAWETALKGLSYNRSDTNAVRVAHAIWAQFETLEDLSRARKILGDIFPDEKLAWEERLNLFEPNDSRNGTFVGTDNSPGLNDDDNGLGGRGRTLDLRIDIEEFDASAARLRAFDADADDSAAEGVTI